MNLRELKRRLLKYLQFKLRNFLNSEYSTEQEIERARIDSYVNFLERNPSFCNHSSLNDTLDVGEIKYLTDREGKTYFRFVCGGWLCDFEGTKTKEELVDWIGKNSYSDEEMEKKLKNRKSLSNE